MERLRNEPGMDVVLMDSPGSLKADGLIPMFVNSDIIIVPFHYDLVHGSLHRQFPHVPPTVCARPPPDR